MTEPAAARPGRNDPCHCGSGKKYKRCCLEKDEKKAVKARAKAASDEAAKTAEPEAAAAPKRPPKPQTHQPWKATATRGFVPKMRTPRKVGGS